MKKLLFAFLALSPLLAAQTAPETSASAPVAALPPLPKAPEPIEPILRLQLFLDSKLFCPGKVDGRPGDFTNKALKRYQAANGLPETEVEAHSLDLSSISDLFTTYTVREEDLKFVGELPSKPSLQSKKKYLPYDSVLEFLTERFHTSPELITWLNRPTKMSGLKPGDAVKVPNIVEPFQIELLQPIPSLPEVPAFQTGRVIKIDTREKLLAVFEGEKMLLSLPITPGSGYLATPPGNWKIIGITQMPTFRWDEGVLNYGVRTSNAYELPIGPNNPVGVMWVGLNKPGIGIHGTAHGQTIGRSSSHGCMRTANWDVVRLVKHISKGMPVIIEGPAPTPRPPPPTPTAAAAAAAKPAQPPTPVAPAKKWFQFWKKEGR